MLVLPLCDEPGLYALPGLHEGLPFGDLAGVVGQHAGQVSTQEQHSVATHLYIEGYCTDQGVIGRTRELLDRPGSY